MIKEIFVFAGLSISLSHGMSQETPQALRSIDTGHTITKVQAAQTGSSSFIAASSYEGTILRVDYDGAVRWTNELSGIMNHDLWCDDITGDGIDEILVANADGAIYCLNAQGKLLWQFQPNEVPMISVCTIRGADGSAYVACGGNDHSFYWLSANGKLIKEVPSSSYETVLRPNKKWADDGTLTYDVHTVNFLRPIPQADGSDVLLVNGVLGNADQKSMLFQFRPLAENPFKSFNTGYGYGPIGDVRVRASERDGKPEILFGTSGMQHSLNITRYDPVSDKRQRMTISSAMRNIGFGYRVVQTETIPDGNSYQYFILVGSNILLVPPSLNAKQSEVLDSAYSYNDISKDPHTEKIILASSMSGGSCIHVIDTSNPQWKTQYTQLVPPGKIQTILDNTETLRRQLDSFQKPKWERDPIQTWLMSPPKGGEKLMKQIMPDYKSPVFLGYIHMKDVEDWDRSSLGNDTFIQARDNRKRYSLSQQEILDKIAPAYNENGLCVWGGHGVDPFYYNLDTLKKMIDAGNGKKSVFIWPELTILYKKDFPFAVDNLFAPFAEHARKNNAKLFLRNKHNFWLANIYSPEWSRFLSGEFADIAIASMEETQDMTMELSLAGRLGLWTSGAFDSWGTRCARDNPSFMRSRQFSHQNLPNHFLRNAVFHISYGAEYINNFNIDSAHSDYMSVLWELIAKGALYVPKSGEIVSFNPVHLSMTQPDDRFLREGHSTTTSIRYDKDFHPNNPYVFDRLDGVWSGAAVTKWDFSRYAAGVKDRRLNFLAPYNNGMIMITPPQNGTFADKDAPRGKMADRLHPLYKNILKEHITDGRQYLSSDGTKKYRANEHYKQIESDIRNGAQKLPLTVSGNVAWTCAQTSPTHLRLTLIDGGYINPSDKKATIQFHTVTPVKAIDVLSKESFDTSSLSSIDIDIPCGLFRFIDIELKKAL